MVVLLSAGPANGESTTLPQSQAVFSWSAIDSDFDFETNEEATDAPTFLNEGAAPQTGSSTAQRFDTEVFVSDSLFLSGSLLRNEKTQNETESGEYLQQSLLEYSLGFGYWAPITEHFSWSTEMHQVFGDGQLRYHEPETSEYITNVTLYGYEVKAAARAAYGSLYGEVKVGYTSSEYNSTFQPVRRKGGLVSSRLSYEIAKQLSLGVGAHYGPRASGWSLHTRLML